MSEKAYIGVNVTADGAVLAQGSIGKVVGFILNPDGTNAGAVTILTGGAAGTILLQGRCLGTVALPIMLARPVTFTDGIYANLTGVGLNVVVLYRKV